MKKVTISVVVLCMVTGFVDTAGAYTLASDSTVSSAKTQMQSDLSSVNFTGGLSGALITNGVLNVSVKEGIPDGAIGESNIKDGEVKAGKLSGVATADIQDYDASASGSGVQTDDFGSTTVNSTNIQDYTVPGTGVQEGNFADTTVNSTNIQDYTVSGTGVQEGNFADTTVNSTNIQDYSSSVTGTGVQEGNFGTGAVTTDKIADGEVGAAKFVGAVSSGTVTAAGVIDWANINHKLDSSVGLGNGAILVSQGGGMAALVGCGTKTESVLVRDNNVIGGWVCAQIQK